MNGGVVVAYLIKGESGVWRCITGLMIVAFASQSYAQHLDLDTYRALTSDFKSFRVGEPISVIVIEATSAESSAGTGLQKDVNVFAEATDSVASISAGFGLGADSNGSGRTERSGMVRTQMSVRIVEVLLDDLYRISGQHTLKINDEVQVVTVTGLIKGKDVSKDNSILSYKIADAIIQVSGKGDVSSANRQNIFFRALDWLGVL